MVKMPAEALVRLGGLKGGKAEQIALYENDVKRQLKKLLQKGGIIHK